MSVNLAITLGRLGKDPQLTTGKTSVCKLSLATSERRKDAAGNWSEYTEWHNVTAFGTLAENCAKYLKKGSLCYVEGRLQTSKYEKDGQTHYSTSIIAARVEFLDGNGKQRAEAAEAEAPRRAVPQREIDDSNEEIPF